MCIHTYMITSSCECVSSAKGVSAPCERINMPVCVCVCVRERERERERESMCVHTHSRSHTNTIHTDGAVGGGARVRDVDEVYLEKGAGMAVEHAVVEQVVDRVHLDPALAHAEAASGLWSGRLLDRL
jgi:hypothetical protein